MTAEREREPRAPASAHPARASGSARPPRTAWASADVLRAALVVATVVVGLRFLWLVHVLLLVTFLGLLFGLVLAAAVDRLERRHVPRGLGALLVVLVLLGGLAGLGFWTAPALSAQFRELERQLPLAVDRIDSWLAARQDGAVGVLLGPNPAAPLARGGDPGSPPSAADLARLALRQAGSWTARVFRVLSSAFGILAGALYVLFVAIYYAVDPGLYRRGFLHLVPHPARPRAEQVMAATAATLRRWLLTQLIAMAVIGGLSTIGLLALGVDSAIALGLIAGLLEFVPFLGPILSAVPAIGMGLLDSPHTALFVAILYFVIQHLENYLLIPMLMKEGMELPPVLTIVVQSLFAVLFGFLGLLVAVPLTGAAMVLVKMLYVEDVIGDPVRVPQG